MIIAATLLLMTAQSGDMDQSRIKLTNCVATVAIEHLEKKSPKKAFVSATKTACTKEKSEYAEKIKADEIEFGASDDEASEYAAEEAQGVFDTYISAYADYLATNTIPTLE